MFNRLGGRAVINDVVEHFYQLVQNDEELSSLFPLDLSDGKQKQKLFIEQWLGGESQYSDLYGHPRLRRRHFPFVITKKLAGLWLRYMIESFRYCGVGEPELAEVVAIFGPMAKHMVNVDDNVSREPLESSWLN